VHHLPCREALVASGKGPLLAAMVEAAEKLWARSLPPGTTPGLPFMAHLWQPLRCSYRPAAFYIITELLTLIGNGALLAAGFAMHRAEGFQYFTYGMAPAATTSSAGAAPASGSGKAPSGTTLSSPCCPTSTSTPLAPLLFLHGVGLGCVPYLDLLLGLAAGGRPLLAPQYTHVSLRWTRCDVMCCTVLKMKDINAASCCQLLVRIEASPSGRPTPST
jgi:hypothetical protein